MSAVTIRLTVDRQRWWAHVNDVAAEVEGLVPVVKGNGYGFGRMLLAELAVRLSPIIATSQGEPVISSATQLVTVISIQRAKFQAKVESHRRRNGAWRRRSRGWPRRSE